MTQASLKFALTIQEHFEEFDRSHPEVYGYLVYLCRDLIHRGFRHYGIGAVYERVRWHFEVEKDMGEDFKLNNNYRSRYARKIMAEFPEEFSDFFEVRQLKS